MMTILRAEHSPQFPFVMMSKKTANDDGLSLAARGLLAWLLDKPDDWKIDPDAIARLNKTTLYEAKKLLNELIREGYLTPPQRDHVKGRWQYTPYMLRETPDIAADVEIQSAENSDAKTEQLLQDDCYSETVSDSPVRTGVQHENTAAPITKINNNSKTGTETETKTDILSTPGTIAPPPPVVVSSVLQSPEAKPNNFLDMTAYLPTGILLLPARTIAPGVEFATRPPREVHHHHSDFLDELRDDTIPGLKPGDKPLYTPDNAWKRIMSAYDSVIGGTMSGDIQDRLTDGIKLRGVQAVLDLLENSRSAKQSRFGYLSKGLKNWQNEKPVSVKRRGKEHHPADDAIWNADGELEGFRT